MTQRSLSEASSAIAATDRKVSDVLGTSKAAELTETIDASLEEAPLRRKRVRRVSELTLSSLHADDRDEIQ
ncbi:hypothetical protein [Leucobacter sp. USHLN153]|uniref:hypothetical protein n=1 Tax=Leucobacter sp. USHLN153 TaxID=3081268 RepID=UPI00301B6A07